MLGKIWDDTLGGPQPDSGLSRLRNATRGGGEGSEVNGVKGKQPKFYIQRSLSIESSASPPSSPTAASSPSPSSAPQGRDNVWKSVFRRGNNINTKSIGSENSDKAEPTVLLFMIGFTAERRNRSGYEGNFFHGCHKWKQ